VKHARLHLRLFNPKAITFHLHIWHNLLPFYELIWFWKYGALLAQSRQHVGFLAVPVSPWLLGRRFDGWQ